MTDPSQSASAAQTQPVFDYTEAVLTTGKHEIVDLSRPRSFIQTKRVYYSIVETQAENQLFGANSLGRIYVQFGDATVRAHLNFVVVGFNLDDYSIDSIGLYISMASIKKLKAVVASTELQLKRIVAELERR